MDATITLIGPAPPRARLEPWPGRTLARPTAEIEAELHPGALTPTPATALREASGAFLAEASGALLLAAART